MEESLEDYIKAYKIHQFSPREEKVLERIIQGAILKFRISRKEFEAMVRAENMS